MHSHLRRSGRSRSLAHRPNRRAAPRADSRHPRTTRAESRGRTRRAIAGNGDRLRTIRTRSAVAGRSGNRQGARRAAQRVALDFAAFKRIMSTKELAALQVGTESKPGTQSTIAAGTGESRMPHIPEELSILPVRGLVVFPGTVIPLNIQRAASLKLLDDTLPRTKVIGLLTQRDETNEDPGPEDLYSVGTAALVLKLIRQEENHVLVIAQGLRRFSLRNVVATSPFLRAEVDLPQSVLPPESKEWEATFLNLRDSAARLFEWAPVAPEQPRLMMLNIGSHMRITS